MGNTVEKHLDITRKLTKTVPPPPGKTSWIRTVDAVVILDNTEHQQPLLNATKIALGENFSVKGYCRTPDDPELAAASGASLKALEYVDCWEKQQEWRRKESNSDYR